MATTFTLDPDEVLIMKSDRITYGDGLIRSPQNELILTNKDIILIIKGAFNKIKTIRRFPLKEIKIYNDQAQAFVGKDRSNSGRPALDIIFQSSQQSFVFEYNKRDVIKWVEKINELVTGKKITSIESNAKFTLPGTEILAKTLKGTVDTYKNVFGIKKKEIHISLNCPGCAAPLSGIKGETSKCPYCQRAVTF